MIERQITEGKTPDESSTARVRRMRLQIVPVFDDATDSVQMDGLYEGCPDATQDVALNLANRQKAIDTAQYGPLNPNEPNDDFWQKKADLWEVTVEDAKTALCGNCAAFDTTDSMKACIETGLSGESDDWSAVEAGELGYCQMFNFKCASARTCDAWITKTEGEIVDEQEIEIETELAISADELEDEMADMGGEDFHALCVVEGVWTGDGRYIEEGALSWRDLPLPLMATDRTTEGHMNAVLVGKITRMERIGREIHAYGIYAPSEDDEVKKLQTLIRDKNLRGISVDLDSVEYEVIVSNPEGVAEPIMDEDGNSVYGVDEMKMRVITARVMGATVVPFPAFQEAYIENLANLTASLAVRGDVSGWIADFASYEDIDFMPPEGAKEEAALGLKWRDEFGRGGTEIGVARARDISNGKNLSPDTIGRMVSYFARHEVDKQGEGWSPDQDGFPSAGRIAWALWGGDPGQTWANKVKDQMESRDSTGSIVASGHPISAPVVPPSSWFQNPKLTAPTPLTVDDDGRIYGHLAVWGQCHMGFGDRCIQPPHSPANYAHFLTGEILCADGLRVPVGQITMNAGHASHQATASQAARHYDNTASAAADVIAGEDEYGIWVSGAMRSTLEPAEIRALMASDVSGDWRRIGGALELVAVLAVNVPGFPKIRVREAEGLVASLSLPAFDGATQETTRSLDAVRHRIAASIGRSKSDRVAEVIKRVKGK